MGIYQKIKDWYTGSNELEDPDKRETLGKLLTGLEALVIGGGVLGLAKKVNAAERRYIDEYFDMGKPIPEIEGARKKTLKGGLKTKIDWIISFQDQNKFTSFYFNSDDIGKELRQIVKSQIDVDYSQFESFVNKYKNSEKFNVAILSEDYMLMGIKNNGKFKGIIIPCKKGTYKKLLKFQRDYFR